MVIGIFRDVTLIALPADRLNDWFIRTDLDPEYKNATLLAAVDYQVSERSTIAINLIESVEGSTQIIASTESSIETATSAVKLSLPVTNPKKWTAEQPY